MMRFCFRSLRSLAWLALFALVAAGALRAQTQADPERQAGAMRAVPRVTAEHGMVVAANPHAARAGLEMLKAGGNAVDALIAASFVLNVVEPQSSGIGGGGFLLLWRAKEKQAITLDGREEAPAAVTPDWFLGPDGQPEPFFPDRITGGKAVGVPGELKLLEKASRLYGKLPFAKTLAPAIRLAAEGFAVSPRLAESLARHRERLAHFPGTRAVFFDGSGDTLKAGTLLRQPDLAATFRAIAKEGSAPFYAGAIAKDIVQAVNTAPVRPGKMALADLAGYDAPLRAPVHGTYGPLGIIGMGPPSSGGPTLIEMLNVLETRATGSLSPMSITLANVFVKAVQIAYADRGAYLADADWVDVPLAGLLDKTYARKRAYAMHWQGDLAPVKPGLPPGAPEKVGLNGSWESPSTTHLVAVDAERNVAQMTASVEQAFGSGIVVPGRGFFLNNELTDFSAMPADEAGNPVANRIEGGKKPRRTALDIPDSLGGKRPRSSMAPTLVTKDGKPLLALGSPGGPRIIQYVAWVLLMVLEQRMDIQAAIEYPHLTHLGGVTAIDPDWPDPTAVQGLEEFRHRVKVTQQNSGLHAVFIDPETNVLHGGVDPRREGEADGY